MKDNNSIKEINEYLINSPIQKEAKKFTLESIQYRLSDIQKRLNDILYRKNQNGLLVSVAESSKKKNRRHMKMKKITGGWEPVEMYMSTSTSDLTIINLHEFEHHFSNKIKIDEEQHHFDF